MNSPFYWVHRMFLISSRLSETLLWPAAINSSISVSHLHPTGGVNEQRSLLCARGRSPGLHLCWSGSKQSQTALSSFWLQWYDDSAMSVSVVMSAFESRLRASPLCPTGVDSKQAIFPHRGDEFLLCGAAVCRCLSDGFTNGRRLNHPVFTFTGSV